VVVSLVSLLLKRDQVAVPCVWSHVHDLRSDRTAVETGWISKTNMFDCGRFVDFAAEMTLGRSSGSLMKYFILAVVIACDNS
jgi:hypothetical protein